jgi:homospermidine synthase
VMSVHELAGKNWEQQDRQRLMVDEITTGIDELGVLLMGHAKGAYWYGSRLSIEQARVAAPHNNATSLQVTAAVLGGIVWAIENPRAGVVEADELDHARVLEVAWPYLGDMVGAYTDWTPLHDRAHLFPEDIDTDCPWQFRNVRVV